MFLKYFIVIFIVEYQRIVYIIIINKWVWVGNVRVGTVQVGNVRVGNVL